MVATERFRATGRRRIARRRVALRLPRITREEFLRECLLPFFQASFRVHPGDRHDKLDDLDRRFLICRIPELRTELSVRSVWSGVEMVAVSFLGAIGAWLFSCLYILGGGISGFFSR